jgi:hypothetical protein
MGVDAPSRTHAADLAGLRERLDDLDRRHASALARLKPASSPERRQQLEAMRYELCEVEWHLARLESH